MSTKVRTDRLRKLADHLMNKMPTGHTFNFGVLYKHPNQWCGTVACAMGELPFCFPDEWLIDIKTADGALKPYLKELSTGNSFDDTGDFFDVSETQVYHLFMPRSQQKTILFPGCDGLYSDATAQQVGLNILYFCALEEGVLEL